MGEIGLFVLEDNLHGGVIRPSTPPFCLPESAEKAVISGADFRDVVFEASFLNWKGSE